MRTVVGNRPLIRWRKAAVVALLVIAALSLSPSAQTRQLKLVSTAWPPFTNAPGQSRFALDLVEAALGRIGFAADTTIVEAAQYTTSLLNGQFDGSAAAWKDAERERVMVFSQPYLENRLILVGRQGGDVSATTLAALKGKRIAIVEGYSYGDITNAGPVFVLSRSEEDSLRQLLDGKVDYTMMDDLVVQYIVDHYANEARTRLQIGTRPLVTRSLHLIVRRALPDAQAVVDKFNGQLRAMIADRTYHRLLHVDWIQADVDGDGRTEYVASSDQSGPVEPQRAYSLFASEPTPSQPRNTDRRYYFGGSLYDSWTVVPEHYKAPDPNRPEPSRSTANIFTFTW